MSAAYELDPTQRPLSLRDDIVELDAPIETTGIVDQEDDTSADSAQGLGKIASRLAVHVFGKEVESLQLTVGDSDLLAGVIMAGFGEYAGDDATKERYNLWTQKIMQGVAHKAIVEATQPPAQLYDLSNFLTTLRKKSDRSDFDNELALSTLQWQIIQRRNPGLDVSLIMPEPAPLSGLSKYKRWGGSMNSRISVRREKGKQDSDPGMSLLAQRAPVGRMDQLFEMMYDDVPDLDLREDVESDETLRVAFVDAVIKEVYERHDAEDQYGKKKRLERLRRYFGATHLSQDESRWFFEHESQLTRDLNMFGLTIQRARNAIESELVSSHNPDQNLSGVYEGLIRPYLENIVRNGDDLNGSTFTTGSRIDPFRKEDGVCAQTDPELFFPEKGGSTREAKKVCQSCDIRDKCLEYAMENDERFGIWGGLSERERRKLKKEREEALAS